MGEEQSEAAQRVGACAAPPSDAARGCPVRTRRYHDGTLAEEGFPLAQLDRHLAEAGTYVWIDLFDPDGADLAQLSTVLGLHPLAVEDAVHEHQRPKIDRYANHLFLSAYAIALAPQAPDLATTEIAAFVTDSALVTVRKQEGFDVGLLTARWDREAGLARHGVGFLVQGLLDTLADGYLALLGEFEERLDRLEEALFSPDGAGDALQRESYALRKSLLEFRRLVQPMSDVLATLRRREVALVDEALAPYFEDIADHVVRAGERSENLRELVTSVLTTHLTIQGNRMNTISKKVTSWAAIIAVPTFVTGFAGMNVPYPGFGHAWGVVLVSTVMAATAIALYVAFRRRDWL